MPAMPSIKVGVIVERVNSKEFLVVYAPKIDIYTSDPNTEFLITDFDSGIIIARYLNSIGFRKCTVYHVGAKPLHNIGRYKNKGGFISMGHVLEAIRQNSDIII